MRLFLCVLVLAAALGVEAAFLSAARWQFNRYQSALQESTAPRPATVLGGQFVPTATTVLDNQPNPQKTSQVGWRLLVPFQTPDDLILIDRGWIPTPANRTEFPPQLLTLTPAEATSLTVTLQAYPQEKGWLKGPLTAAHPRILARMSPAPIPAPVSTTHFGYELRADNPLPPLRNPGMHRSYMLQWLGLAIAFPLLAGGHFIRRLRRSRQR